MTRNGWSIRIDTDVLVEHQEYGNVLNKFYFIENLKSCIKSYKAEVLGNKKRGNAFIRKTNCICKMHNKANILGQQKAPVVPRFASATCDLQRSALKIATLNLLVSHQFQI